MYKEGEEEDLTEDDDPSGTVHLQIIQESLFVAVPAIRVL